MAINRLEKQEQDTANRVLKAEVRYHFIKAVYILIIMLGLVGFITYNNIRNRQVIQKDSGKTRELLRCSLPAFTPQNYNNADKIVDGCLKANE